MKIKFKNMTSSFINLHFMDIDQDNKIIGKNPYGLVHCYFNEIRLFVLWEITNDIKFNLKEKIANKRIDFETIFWKAMNEE